jgi:LPS O-antigen subunit length determinant protein (WzzB/FepE family)
MNSAQYNANNDEVNIKEVFILLWNGKFLILFCVVLAIILASIHLRGAERKYSITYKLKPVLSIQNSNPGLSSLSKVASFAGMDIPRENNLEILIYKELFTSIEVSERLFSNQKMVKRLYSNEWNAERNKYLEPVKSPLQKFIQNVKSIITGSKKMIYEAPTPKRFSALLKSVISINEDKDTGFLIIKSHHSRPELILSLIIAAAETTDQIMRERYIKISNDPLKFYKEKIATARSREHREALAQLIGSEERKLMLASSGAYFVAEPFLRPMISTFPTSPRSNLILMLALFIGIIISCFIILLKNIFLDSKAS